jgi:glycolate oxidase iron-sulfur subunit
MTALLPRRRWSRASLAEVTPAVGQRRARRAARGMRAAGALADINSATIRVLAAHGVEVVVPRGQGCAARCSALGHDTHARPAPQRSSTRFQTTWMRLSRTRLAAGRR